MDFDFVMENDSVVFSDTRELKEEKRKQKRVLVMASRNLRKMVIERLNGRMGDC